MSSAGGDGDGEPIAAALLIAVVRGSLYAHPHDNTPQAIAAAIGDARITENHISQALEALVAARLVHTDGRHWQLSGAGYRAHREAARRE